MQKMTDILRGVRNALALYGGVCLVSGVTMQQLEKNWDKICDKTGDRLSEWIFGKPREKIYEAEFEEVE